MSRDRATFRNKNTKTKTLIPRWPLVCSWPDVGRIPLPVFVCRTREVTWSAYDGWTFGFVR